MLNLPLDNWHYLHGKPILNAKIKQDLVDFKVDEQLSFTPSGEGEHTFIHLEKTALNTAFVAESLAKYGQLPLRNVSYAGRKDKFAKTSQWFSVYHADKAKSDWTQFALPGVTLIEITKNDRKLRTGAIRSNRFEILLRQITSGQDNTLVFDNIQQRVESICQLGVPNYYGNQRFGELIKPDGSSHLGGNLILAEKLINGEEIRNRNKRSMAISAMRSWLFNHFVSARLNRLSYAQLLSGDVLSLAGTNSFFVNSSHTDANDLQKRLAQKDILLTAPLWGKGKLNSTEDALAFEQKIAADYPMVCQTLMDLKLEQQRRPILLFPEDFTLEISDNSALLKFSLPSGCFATSVIREIANV